MAWSCKILQDSISLAGVRLTTFEVTYPRMIHAEIMTHKMLSKNAASSRAIPIQKMLQRVKEDPAMPVWWGKNQSGMQASEQLEGAKLLDAQWTWLQARDRAVQAVELMELIGLHKQISNRILEPWMWITVIISGTEWANFFALRCHKDAQPEFQKIAKMMRHAYYTNKPVERLLHLPLIQPEERRDQTLSFGDLKKISVGRCARVSYLTHDGKRDPQADIDLHDKLMVSGHWSPFEHVASAMEDPVCWSANFRGWHQYRKDFANENRTEHIYNPEADSE
jgi:hypothetical protein